MLKQTVKIWVIAMAVILLISSCQKDETVNLALEETPSAIQAYFDRFESEAAQRGIKADIEAQYIYGVFEELENRTIGNCSYSGNSPRRVSIDPTYWARATDLEREYLVFHELGHCFLGRGHDNGKSDSGACSSMMQSGEGACRMRYDANTKEAYIDELFQN